MTGKGFTLLEFLISLSLIFVIVLAGFGFFVHAHTLFFKLRDAVEDSQDALSAIDKIRIDLMRAGGGLVFPEDQSLLEVLSAGSGKLTILRAESAFILGQDVTEGDQRIYLSTAEGLKAGARICVIGPHGGEVLDVIRVEGNVLVAGLPFQRGYMKESARVLSLEKISFFLDGDDRIIRRQVNSSPAQPLVEGVESFIFSYDKPANLVSLSFTLMSHKDKTYELCLFPKNIGLSPGR